MMIVKAVTLFSFMALGASAMASTTSGDVGQSFGDMISGDIESKSSQDMSQTDSATDSDTQDSSNNENSSNGSDYSQTDASSEGSDFRPSEATLSSLSEGREKIEKNHKRIKEQTAEWEINVELGHEVLPTTLTGALQTFLKNEMVCNRGKKIGLDLEKLGEHAESLDEMIGVVTHDSIQTASAAYKDLWVLGLSDYVEAVIANQTSGEFRLCL